MCWAGEPGREQRSICEHRQGVGGPQIALCLWLPAEAAGGKSKLKILFRVWARSTLFPQSEAVCPTTLETRRTLDGLWRCPCFCIAHDMKGRNCIIEHDFRKLREMLTLVGGALKRHEGSRKRLLSTTHPSTVPVLIGDPVKSLHLPFQRKVRPRLGLSIKPTSSKLELFHTWLVVLIDSSRMKSTETDRDQSVWATRKRGKTGAWFATSLGHPKSHGRVSWSWEAERKRNRRLSCHAPQCSWGSHSQAAAFSNEVRHLTLGASRASRNFS